MPVCFSTREFGIGKINGEEVEDVDKGGNTGGTTNTVGHMSVVFDITRRKRVGGAYQRDKIQGEMISLYHSLKNKRIRKALFI